MLTIRDISSPVSKSQNGTPCDTDCLGWPKLPLYSFARRASSKSKGARPYDDLQLVPDLYETVAVSDGSSDDEEEKSFLDALLLAKVSTDIEHCFSS